MKLAASVYAALMLFVAPSIRADIPPPNSSQCGDKKGGDACTLEQGGDGVCEEQTCARALPGGTSEYPCTICVPAAAKPAEDKPAEPAPTTKKSNCAGGGAESLLALGAAVAIVARRRRG